MSKYKKPSNVVVGEQPPSHKLAIPIILAVVAVVILAGAAGGWYFVQKGNDSTTLTCPNSIMSEAVPILGSTTTDLTTRGALVDKILTTDNYSSEPNCLAILTSYYIDVSDVDQAKYYNDLLAQNYNESTGYQSPISGYLLPPAGYSEQITFLEKQAEAVLHKGGQYGGVFGDESSD